MLHRRLEELLDRDPVAADECGADSSPASLGANAFNALMKAVTPRRAIDAKAVYNWRFTMRALTKDRTAITM